MILLDGPYVSELMKKHIETTGLQVIETPFALIAMAGYNTNFINEQEAIKQLTAQEAPKLYTNSENAIDWVQQHLPQNQLSRWLRIFKDKAAFRRLSSSMFPDYFFKEIPFSQLKRFDAHSVKYPCILKPNVGFFSLGVHTLSHAKEWADTVEVIEHEMDSIRNLYPTQVLDVSSFIVEEVIQGDEFAFDAYFDKEGQPVILGIYQHYFSSPQDVSDRVYITSKEILDRYSPLFYKYLTNLGQLLPLRNFPLHTEVRVDEQQKVMPIEINPMRYGGWCTTADMVQLGLGFSPYQYYLESRIPNWTEIWKNRSNSLFSVVVLDNSTGLPGSQIHGFDYAAVSQKFEHILELRKADYKKFPLFGFVFSKTRKDNFQELDAILKSSLKEFIVAENIAAEK